ncbi:MAG: hypothetical protein ACFFCW_49605 [Candidatus Hodarchaeota archaeon]
MKNRKQILIPAAIAGVLAVLAWLLLEISTSIAVWISGPYFLLVSLLPKSADTLVTLVIIIFIYYFVSSLVVIKGFSRRTLIFVVSIVIVLNSLGAYLFHLL